MATKKTSEKAKSGAKKTGAKGSTKKPAPQPRTGPVSIELNGRTFTLEELAENYTQLALFIDIEGLDEATLNALKAFAQDWGIPISALFVGTGP